MEFGAYPIKKATIYNKYLKEVNGIKFTSREIDTIACILHGRKEKKIATLLSIAPKTVNVHIYNIMSKLGYNSRELIIDFVEKSGKLQHLRQYYFCVVVQNLFEETLNKIAKTVNSQGVDCKFFCTNITKQTVTLSKLMEYLTLARIKLIKLKSNDLNNAQKQNIYQETEHDIHVVTEKSEIASIQKNNRQDQGNKQRKNIILLFNDSDIVDLPDVSYIDFRIEEDFYDSTLILLQSIINKPELSKIIEQFKEEYKGLYESWKGNGKLNDEEGCNSKKSVPKKNFVLILIILFFICAVIIFFFINKKYKQDLAETDHQFSEFMNSFSFDNIGITEGLRKNINFLRNIDEVVSSMNHQQMLNYIQSNKSSNEQVLNYVYGIHAVAQNLLYNEYNNLKARKLLQIAKDAIECYVNSRTKIKTNFNEINSKELYTELNVISEMPEAYTKILYLLGRTYTYFEEINISSYDPDQMPVEEFENYYKIASYVGNKVKIFEGFLSERNLIEMVRLFKIKRDMKYNNSQKTIEDIIESIKMLDELKNDNTQYILDYHPGTANPKTIIPSQDNYNKLFLIERILQHYSRLLTIQEDKIQKLRYAHEILIYLVGDNMHPGVLDELDGVPDKKVACLLNSLGFVLLQFFEQNIGFIKIQDVLRAKLKLTAMDELEQIGELFEFAKTKSRNNHYPKAHSYKGLIRTYKNTLERKNLTNSQVEEVNNKIKELEQKSENLNKQIRQNF